MFYVSKIFKKKKKSFTKELGIRAAEKVGLSGTGSSDMSSKALLKLGQVSFPFTRTTGDLLANPRQLTALEDKRKRPAETHISWPVLAQLFGEKSLKSHFRPPCLVGEDFPHV